MSDDKDQMVSYHNIKALCLYFATYNLLQFLKEAYIGIDRLWYKLGDYHSKIQSINIRKFTAFIALNRFGRHMI